jgi:hypothetical protein
MVGIGEGKSGHLGDRANAPSGWDTKVDAVRLRLTRAAGAPCSGVMIYIFCPGLRRSRSFQYLTSVWLGGWACGTKRRRTTSAPPHRVTLSHSFIAYAVCMGRYRRVLRCFWRGWRWFIPQRSGRVPAQDDLAGFFRRGLASPPCVAWRGLARVEGRVGCRGQQLLLVEKRECFFLVVGVGLLSRANLRGRPETGGGIPEKEQEKGRKEISKRDLKESGHRRCCRSRRRRRARRAVHESTTCSHPQQKWEGSPHGRCSGG